MKITGQSLGCAVKALLLTTALMGAGIVLTSYPTHAADGGGFAQKTWETELSRAC